MTATDRPTAVDAELESLGAGPPLPPAGLVPDLVAAAAREHPDQPAVRSGGRTLTYAELVAHAGRLAARLTAAGAGRGSTVGVLVEPSVDMVVAALAVLRAGAAYVPVDRSQPAARVTELLADAGVVAAVVGTGAADRLAGVRYPLVPAADAPGPELPPVPPADDDPAYVIYTSGSTGEPKGVVVEHGQLAASTLARRLVYPGAPTFLLVSPLCFDSSVAGLWGTLTAGGCLVVATADEIPDPELLLEMVTRHKVTRLLCVPSLYAVVLDAVQRLGPAALSTLDTVTVAGEPLPEPLLARHLAVRPGPVALVNEYGPTEATVWASYRLYDGPGPVSIGGPVPGARLYVLDERLRPVPRGVEGELVIGGAGVARGYLGRPEATARSFVPDPYTGGRMYRTGDLVRWTAEGTLDFRGRRDHQVKIRGHRVELGAVEAALRAAPGVRDAVVVPDRARTGLTGYVVAPGAGLEPVRAALAERLPKGLMPRLRALDDLPRTVTGKVDRAALADREPPGGPERPVGQTPLANSEPPADLERPADPEPPANSGPLAKS